MEIEAKFRVDDERIFADLQGLTAIGSFQLERAPTSERQHNTYFDTTDQRLRQQKFGLRIRDLGGRRIATLKGASRGSDGVYERDEWEIEIGADDHPAAWPESEARSQTLALLGDAAPLPILNIRTNRQHIYVARDGAQIAEISLDSGTISAGARTQDFCELEIELLDGGSRADLDALIELLGARYTLIPEDQSKLARGLALLNS